VLTFEGFSTELGGKKYLNLRPKTATDDTAEHWDVKPRYLFVLYSVVNGGLTLSLMDDAIVKTAVTDGKLKGRIENDDVVLTEETGEARRVREQGRQREALQPVRYAQSLTLSSRAPLGALL